MTLILMGALLIGLTLGMLGSGGSSLTVPVLIYVVGHGTKESIAESMAIVGLISLVAAIPYARAGQIDWRSVYYFGIPGILGTLIGAWLGGIAPASLQLVVFGAVLLAAAAVMLRRPAVNSDGQSEDIARRNHSPVWKIAIEGTAVGVVTGFVGVGGGFLIVPSLVVLGKLPIRLAIGTSLVIIAIKAAVGFAKYEQFLLSHGSTIDTQTVVLFAGIGILGSFVGRFVNARLNQRILGRTFAVLLILLGGFVMLHEGSKLVKGNSTAQLNDVRR